MAGCGSSSVVSRQSSVISHQSSVVVSARPVAGLLSVTLMHCRRGWARRMCMVSETRRSADAWWWAAFAASHRGDGRGNTIKKRRGNRDVKAKVWPWWGSEWSLWAVHREGTPIAALLPALESHHCQHAIGPCCSRRSLPRCARGWCRRFISQTLHTES